MSQENTPLDKACAEIERLQAQRERLLSAMKNAASMLDTNNTSYNVTQVVRYLGRVIREESENENNPTGPAHPC